MMNKRNYKRDIDRSKLIIIEYSDEIIDNNNNYKDMALKNDVVNIFKYNIRQCNIENYGSDNIRIRELEPISDFDDQLETAIKRM